MKYVQGMSYLMTLLLMFYTPYKAFKYFTNLVLTKKFLYKTYLFKKNYLAKINVILEHIVSKYYLRLYQYLKKNRFELWSIFWVEWIYAMFLRTFDLKTSLKLWDFILVKGEFFIFKLNFVVFGLIDENFNILSKDNFFDECKKLVFNSHSLIVERVNNDTNHEFEYFYIQKLVEKERLSQ